MNEQINILNIVKDLPIGTSLYSTLCGKCVLYKIYDNTYFYEYEKYEDPAFRVVATDGSQFDFNMYGHLPGQQDGEVLIFPSAENKDWHSVKNEELSEFEHLQKQLKSDKTKRVSLQYIEDSLINGEHHQIMSSKLENILLKYDSMIRGEIQREIDKLKNETVQ